MQVLREDEIINRLFLPRLGLLQFHTERRNVQVGLHLLVCEDDRDGVNEVVWY